MTIKTPLPATPVLLYDGTCGFCAQSVQFVLAADRRRRTMLFAPLGGPLATEVRRQFPETATADSIILYVPAPLPGEARALLRSDAAGAVGVYLGGWWKVLAMVARLVPRGLRDKVYNAIARHRHQIAGADVCLLPTSDQRARFLDLE